MKAFSIFLAMVCVLISIATPCSAAFTSSDLAGNWAMFWMETASSSGLKYWIEGEINLNASGSITGGSWVATSGTSGLITDGALKVSPQGELSGQVELSNGLTTRISGGWLDTSKTVAYVVTTKTNGGTDCYASGILIKETSDDFATSQIAGNWEGFATEARSRNSYWLHSALNVQSSGSYTGRWYHYSGVSGDIEDSMINLYPSGMMTGTLVVASGGGTEPGNILAGQMDANRQIGCVDYLKDNGKAGTMVLINGDQTGFSTANLQGEWAIYITEMIPVGAYTVMYWIKGAITLSSSGQLLSGTWESFQGTTGTFTSGTITLQTNGQLGGTLESSNGKIMRIERGRLAGSKTIGTCLLQKGSDLSSLDTLDYVFMIRKPGKPLDFDGDGKADIGCYDPTAGNWFIYLTGSDALWTTNYSGGDGTKPVSGFFDSDILCDYGTYFAPSGLWLINRSESGSWTNNFGFAGTSPITGDFDGDGITDFGCYNPPDGGWFVFKSKTSSLWLNNFGFDNTYPVTGDFDGDGISDFGCYYPPDGGWFIYKSKTSSVWLNHFGYEGTLPITGDFDGDGTTDFGCYDATNGYWFIFKSSTESLWTTAFGFEGTTPIVGDYDGDDIDDFGCYYPPSGGWYIFKSSTGFWTTQFGFEGTIAIQ